MFARGKKGSFDFKRLHGGRFDRNYWGTIKLSKFSTIGVFAEEETASIDYLAYLLGLRHKGTDSLYSVALVASHNLNVINQVCDELCLLCCIFMLFYFS